MKFLANDEERLLRSVSGLAFGNPFLPDRIEFEKQALGSLFVPGEAVWSFRSDLARGSSNVVAIAELTELAAEGLRQRLLQPEVEATAAQLALYEDLIAYLLFSRFQIRFYETILRTDAGAPFETPFYPDFLRAHHHFLAIDGIEMPRRRTPAMMFALMFQVRRAFHHIFSSIIGTSMAAARLRAAVWESIFTSDLQRYERGLYDRLADVTTLILGPTGSGKELVARAIGLSRFVPFDERLHRFPMNTAGVHSVNLSALAPTLIESELFGHRKGAFTGALQDRKGWLETCGTRGSVFLDEIGDLDASIQVKLLRVLQTRTFERLGETQTRQFHGKIIAATHRDLGEEIAQGRFREDFFYRLCADVITTPSLREQLEGNPDELLHLARFAAKRLAGDREGEELAAEVATFVERELGRDYGWPGNFRELEQCVRSVMVRGEYRPLPRREDAGGPRKRLASRFLSTDLTAEELLRSYCTLAYAKTPSYVEVADRLGIDRRTVKSKIDPALLEGLEPTG